MDCSAAGSDNVAVAVVMMMITGDRMKEGEVSVMMMIMADHKVEKGGVSVMMMIMMLTERFGLPAFSWFMLTHNASTAKGGRERE